MRGRPNMKAMPKGAPRTAPKKGVFGRLIKELFKTYPAALPIVIIAILVNAIVSSIPMVFMQNIIKLIEQALELSTPWAKASSEIVKSIVMLASLYLISIILGFFYNRMMAIITQGFLHKLRLKMFGVMQSLPVRFFDSNNNGDIMSYYTNDVDTMRQLISQSLPHILTSVTTVLTVAFLMIYYSIWLFLVVCAGVVAMLLVTSKVGGNSSRYFIGQQKSIADTEGYVEEMMNGQKVVKVFCHEQESREGFDKLNDKLFENARRANKYANILMPILGNIGNILYVIVALVGGALLVLDVPNLSLSGTVLGINIVVPFLNMTKQFSGNIGQVSSQINSIVMGLAGASRVFELIDQETEVDNGYVTLVNTREENGKLIECKEKTGVWAWKHPHSADGSVTYTKLLGDVRMNKVDFGYVPEKIVLKNVSLYAEPGQKVAFVGSTGAGKTTITNLINRFYDIADGKIRYDGININKIKKADLRRSLGIVLQEINLFTGTVMDNIRYGKLDATDEECIAAAKLVGAHSFIKRLPDGYNTKLSAGSANLSQGQRQLIAIARAAVNDPPVMIMDEATSSIDTRTEAIVQRGMDALMKGRTVFVIAHRLSTIKNSDVIMMLDHGEIIERGSHDELMAKKGKYYELYTGAFELD